ncbi:MAG: peptidoglycan bridge formation glycyltransferase FemA/FemB family protein [Candidatus Pacebacteria bacterium]|nr:peptidoglycan bridge formation glycyltransferase FemA/FemB family protein [Candidatus Paceibacterota bacterium]
MIDLEKTEEDILLNMKKKTRYNIKLSQKKGVVFSVSRKKTDIKDFLNLMDTTATRNKIKNHKKEYYQKIFDNFDDKTVRLYIATYQGKIVAGIVSIFFGDIVTSLYGASDKKYHNLKSPYGLR